MYLINRPGPGDLQSDGKLVLSITACDQNYNDKEFLPGRLPGILKDYERQRSQLLIDAASLSELTFNSSDNIVKYVLAYAIWNQ
jgi:hypothetical protein